MPRAPSAPRSTVPEPPGPFFGPARGRGAGLQAAGQPGTWLVVGLLLLGVTAAVGAIWFQRRQTRKCLDFYGPTAARRITSAAEVELLAVRPGRGPRRLAAVSGLDTSKAAGLVHLRRGLVEDANFIWPDPGTAADPRSARPSRAPRPLDSWDAALVFTSPAGGGKTTLVIDLDAADGALAVVGQPGWIGLGRIGPGLAAWIRDTRARAGSRDGPVEGPAAQPAESR